MFIRVVRFADVSLERIEAALARIKESGGPPPGVPPAACSCCPIASRARQSFLQYFDSAEDMAAGARVLAAMDAWETPGTRASVDSCKMELDISP